MKVNYIDKNNTTTLKLIEVGALFRPINSIDLYIKLDTVADSRLFKSSNSTVIWDNVAVGYDGENFNGKEEFELEHEYSELILCADVITGEIYFLYENIKVESLKCELLVG